jgi:hypothetical protein
MCPICGMKLRHKRWSDDVAGAATCTETLEECSQGHYRWHWAYGLTEVVVGREQFGWSYSDEPEAVKAIEAQIETAITEAKATPAPPP